MDAPDLDPQALHHLLECIDHELRTPLNGVTGAADLLAVTALTAEQKEYVQTIASGGERLLDHLQGVLDYLRLAAGQLSLNEAPFALEAALETGFRAARERGVREASVLGAGHVTLDMGGGVPQGVVGDAERFRQVVEALTHHLLLVSGGAPLEVSVVRHGRLSDGRARVRLDFACEAELTSDRLTELRRAFLHGDAAGAPRMNGEGLSLAIARGLIDLMEGRVRPAELTPGEERLSIELPLRAAEVVAPVADGAPGHAAPHGDLRILVVEDDAMAQRVAAGLLDKAGYQHDLAQNGKEAVQAAALVDYDVILMDLIMPVMDGIEATRTIRENEARGEGPRTPIIAMTANGLVSDPSACRQLGMDDYIAKPVRAAALYAILEKWVGEVSGTSSPGRV